MVRALFEVIESGNELSVKSITHTVNAEYANTQDKLSYRATGRILDGLGIRRKLHDRSRRAIVDAEASKSTLDLLHKQYGLEGNAKDWRRIAEGWRRIAPQKRS